MEEIMLRYTGHCEIRMNQRGIKKTNADLVFQYADIIRYGEFGRTMMMISNANLQKLVEKEEIKPTESERLKGIWVIMESANDNGPEVVTTYSNRKKRIKDHRRKRGNRK
jgi:hypothetical protein